MQTILTRHFANQATKQSARDPLMLVYCEQVLNGMVGDLYFPDEPYGAGLQLFDLVEHARLSGINTIPKPDRLSRLRHLFETLYDGAHHLRIIEGKT